MTSDTLTDIFAYHSPTNAQVATMAELRHLGFVLCDYILSTVPDCADRTAAINKVREAIMVANAAIVLDGKV